MIKKFFLLLMLGLATMVGGTSSVSAEDIWVYTEADEYNRTHGGCNEYYIISETAKRKIAAAQGLYLVNVKEVGISGEKKGKVVTQKWSFYMEDDGIWRYTGHERGIVSNNPVAQAIFDELRAMGLKQEPT